MTGLTSEQIKSVLTVSKGRIVWAERTADFYETTFKNAYDPKSAAEGWNDKSAGNPPAWRFDQQRDDYTCTACLRNLTLRATCAALGVSYNKMRDAVTGIVDEKKEKAAKIAVQRSVVLVDGNPVWKVRTTADFPKTLTAKLDEFNAKYAGKQISPRSDGKYRIRFNSVTLEQMKEWLQ
jgi:hypothetical protein